MIKELMPKTHHCKNCGAEVIHSYNHKCSYCGGLIDFNEPEEKVIEVKPEDLVNITLRDVYRDFKMNNLIILFDGYKCVMPKVYEYNDKSKSYVSKVEEYVNPPKCGFCIEIPIFELEKFGIGYLKSVINNSGIRFNEIDRVMQQVLDNREIRFILR